MISERLTGCSSENDRMQADKISIQQTEEPDLSNAPAGYAPQVGDVDCYMPWGNHAIYYKGDSNSYSTDMVPMGRIVRGIELLAAQKETFDVFLELDE